MAHADAPPTIINFADVLATPPFSFVYNGQPSSTLLPTWTKTTGSTTLSSGQIRHTVTWTDPSTHLQVQWIGDEYPGYTTIGWTVYFTNNGSANTPALTDVLAMDVQISSLPSGSWSIHTGNGSNAAVTDFAPFDLALPSPSYRVFTTNGGRPTDGNYAGPSSGWQYLTGSSGAPGYYDTDQHATRSAGALATFTFTGTSVTWIGPKNVDCGIAAVYIDGVQVSTVDLYATSWLKQQTLFTSSTLSNASHTIEIVNTGTKNASASDSYVSIDAFAYAATGSVIVDDTSSAINYTGSWQALTGSGAPGYYDTDQHASNVTGAAATFTFTGTSASWIGPKNVDCGIASIYVDGSLVGTVDLYATSWLKQQTLFTTSTLTNASHTLEIVASGTKNPSASDYYISIDAFSYISNATVTINDNDPSIGYSDGSATASNVVNAWPYYNIDLAGTGLICALGWPGQWGVEVKRVNSTTLHLYGAMTLTGNIGAGQEISALGLTNLWLAPGESIRTPLIVLQPWNQTSWHDAQNVWRRWMLQYHVPRQGSGPAQPLCPTQANDYFSGQTDAASDELNWMNTYGVNDATAGTGGVQDHWWIDAGWYQTPSDWTVTGTWSPDPTRFPSGLKPVTDRARALGMAAIVWFEPERVMPNTDIANNHPSYLLDPMPGDSQYGGQAKLFDFGDPTALSWAISYFSGLITSLGVDFYREDFNIQPLPFWQHADPADRQGITQAHYVDGHLQFWAGLQAAHPGLLIDSCASGGRRLDILSLNYAINLLRSDDVLDATSNQSHVLGLSSWVPLHGGAVRITGSTDDVYNARSAMGPSYHEALDISAAGPVWTQLKTMASEWQSISGHYIEDFYPLTPHSTATDQWVAWQFGTASSGMVQAFRRPSSSVASQTLLMYGLTGGSNYQLHDLNTGVVWNQSGSSLLATGVAVTLTTAPLATSITYAAI